MVRWKKGELCGKVDEKLMGNAVDFIYEFSQNEGKVISEDKIMHITKMCREEKYYNSNMARIVLIGRVNAGKSMLVNAMLGKRLAAVEVFEKTSWIARYWPSDKEFCCLRMENGEEVEITPEEFISKTENDEYSMEYLRNISRIDVGYVCNDNNYAIIDTPGFGSVNSENEIKSMESLKDADLVIYVVDVNKIGNLRERAIIEEIKKSGISMICVGTHYDGDICRTKNKQQIINMVNEYTGFEKEEIYVTSAKEYFRNNSVVETGIEELKEACKKISVSNKLYRVNAESSRIFRNNNIKIQYINEIKQEICNMQKGREKIESDYDYARDRIRSEIESFIREYVPKTLYAEYKHQIVHAVELASKQKTDEDRMKHISNIIPVGYMDSYWTQLIDVITVKLNELWSNRLSIENQDLQELRYLLNDNIAMRNLSAKEFKEMLQLGYTKELTNNGVKLSFGVASLTSIYEAILGANAAQVALSTAFISTGIPIMLIGCGMIAYWTKKKKNEQQQLNILNVKKILEKNIDIFSDNIIEKCLSKLKAVDEHVKTIYIGNYDEYIKKYCPNGKTMDELIKSCDIYVSELFEENSNLPFYNVGQNDMTSYIFELQNKIVKLENDLQNTANDNINLNGRITDLENVINEHNKEKDKLINECDKAKKELKSAEDKVKRKENELARCQKKVKAAEKNKSKLKEAKKQEERAKEELKNAQEKEKEAKDKLTSCEKNLGVKNERINALCEENDQLKKELAEKNKCNENMEKEIIDLKNQLIDRNPYLLYNDRKKKILNDLNSIVHNGMNKYRLNAEKHQAMNEFENLMFLEEENYKHFLKIFEEMLLQENEFAKKNKKNIIELIDGKKIYTYPKAYRIYYTVEKHTTYITVNYIETFATDNENNRNLRLKNGNTFILQDDQIRYKLFDAISMAKKEILIAVPWITEKAWVNENQYGKSMETELEKALQREPLLKIVIATGYSSENSEKRENVAETDKMVEKIRNKFSKYGSRLKIHNNCVIHIKYLVIDDICSIHGSLNFLSNQSVYNCDENNSNSNGRAGESMAISENIENVERARVEVCERAHETYKRLNPMSEVISFW